MFRHFTKKVSQFGGSETEDRGRNRQSNTNTYMGNPGFEKLTTALSKHGNFEKYVVGMLINRT